MTLSQMFLSSIFVMHGLYGIEQSNVEKHMALQSSEKQFNASTTQYKQRC